MEVIVIIQARLGSSRLPGKVLLPLGSKDILSYVVERCNQIQRASKVIVATSTKDIDDAIVDWCSEHTIECYRGSEEDVLSRFMGALSNYQPDYVMRVTADCPFVDYHMANDILEMINQTKVDIVDIDFSSLPRGLATELISYRALKYIDLHGKEQRHREHVTYYAYEYKDEFTRVRYTIPTELQNPKLRITLDTEEDYHLIYQVAEALNDILVSSVEVVKYLEQHPEIANINAHIEQKPVI